ncbi:MAG: tetratricopeptide repeat protein [Desulfobacterales bacterium]|jgi:tetratricopeptide (TPR) repeat protein
MPMSALSRKQHYMLLLMLGLLVAAIYANIMGGPYYFDDYFNIRDNHHIRLKQLTLNGLLKAAFENPIATRPVAYISFGLNYYLGGYDVFGYHVVNIVIHLITGLLLYLLAKTTLQLRWEWDRGASNLKIPGTGPVTAHGWGSLDPSWVSFWTAALWLVHPVQTQSVTYIVQRMNSMAAMFCVLSLLLYARGRISQKRRANESERSPVQPYLWFAGSLLGGLLALGTKEIAATLPFFILLYEWYFFQDLSRSWLKRYWIWVVVISIVFVLVVVLYLSGHPWDKILAGYAGRDFTPLQRVLTEFRVVIFYLSLLIWPHPSRLNLEHDFALSTSLFDPVTTVLSLGVLVGLLVLAIALAPRQRILSFCLLWFLGNLVIESSVIGLELVFEHRLYMPSMFMILAAVMLFCRHIRSRRLQAILLGVVVMVSAWGTFERNKVWQDEVTFYSDCVKKTPNKARAHDGLGIALFKQGRVEEAIARFNESLRLDPGFAPAHNNLGVALIRQEKFYQALYHFQEAVRLLPGYVDAFNNLNKLENNLQIDAHIDEIESQLITHPSDSLIHCELANLYLRRDRLDEARVHYQKSLELDPGHYRALDGLAAVNALTGKYDEAISLFQKAIARQPENPDAYFYVACVYAKQGKKSLARSWLQKAVKRGYHNPQAFKNGFDLKRLLRSEFDAEE